MSFPAAMAWFSSTVVFILATFAFVEKFASKEDLEKYYLLITVRRFKFSAQWYLLLIKFVDVFFGFHQYRRLMLPSVLRVAVYTLCTTAVIFFGLKSVRRFDLLLLFPFLFSLPGNFLFDYFNFLKTRLVLEFVAKRRTVISIMFGVFLEISLLLLLFVISFCIITATFFIVLYNINNIGKVVKLFHEETILSWYIILISFFKAVLESGIVFNLLTNAMLTNIVAAGLSTIVVILFVAATIASYIANNISVLQQFLDRHTAVLDKPIQTLGAMVVVIFAVLFWTWFGLDQLVVALIWQSDNEWSD